MSRIKGTVTTANKGKFGYFLKLDGADFYYNTKFKPKCGEGDVVGIEFTAKGPNRGQISQIKVLESKSGGYDASNSENRATSASSGGWSASAASGPSTDRQDSIMTQHSQEMAVDTAKLLLEQGAYAIKGTPDQKRIQIMGLINELTVMFFEQAEKPRATVLAHIPSSAAAEPAAKEDDWGDEGGEDDSWEPSDDSWSD